MRKILSLLLLLCGIVTPMASLAEKWPDSSFTDTVPTELMPEIRFADENGAMTGLQSMYGNLVVLNFWATWCAPCVKEMPALSKLQEKLGSYGIRVLPVSMDRNGPAAVRKFYNDQKITNLPVLMEAEHTISRLIKPRGLPLTIIVGRDGREWARAYGDVAWDSKEMLDFMQKLAYRRY